MIRYLIDADSSIYAMVDADSPVNHRIVKCEPGEIGISAISFAEIAFGTRNGKPPGQEILDAFAGAVPVIPFNEAAARVFGTLHFRKSRLHDLMLAAHALSLDVIIITNNEADFTDVPGLKVENWTR